MGGGRARLLASLTSPSPDDGLQVQASTLLPARLRKLQVGNEISDSTSGPGESVKAESSAERPAQEEKEQNVIRKSGSSGRKIGAFTNYIRLDLDPDKGVFEYEVRFEPQIHDRNLRFKV